MSTSQLSIDDLLKTAVERDASDIHIKADTPPLLRIYGELIPTDLPPLSEDEAKRRATGNASMRSSTHFAISETTRRCWSSRENPLRSSGRMKGLRVC